MVKFLNITPLPLRICRGVYKIFFKLLKIINCIVFKHYSITFNNIWGGGSKIETGNNIWGGLKTETGNFGGSKN